MISAERSYDSRARVFVSCGQLKDSGESVTAAEIARRLEELGFDPYIAIQEQSVRGLKENIFERLENSEYFIFVDFKREQLLGTEPPVCRGSLFSHQELALASYLGIPVLAFQESGVKQDDGIIRFLQANAIPFRDRHLLANVIADEVRRRRWDTRWRNELVLERLDPTQHGDAEAIFMGEPRSTRFFHIGVRNRRRHKMARNCYVYLEQVGGSELVADVLRAVEIKWEGYVQPNAHIPPRTVRRFDAFFVFRDEPTRLLFQTFSDSSALIPRLQGEGRYELRYSVVADNFPTARGCFRLDLNCSLNSTTLIESSGA